MAAIDIIRRRLKEERVPDVPDELGEKKKRPREVAFMDVNLCNAPSVTLRDAQELFLGFPALRRPDACIQGRSFRITL